MDAQVSNPATSMSKPARRRFSIEFKTRVVCELIEGTDSASVVARRYDLNTNQLFRGKREVQRCQTWNESVPLLPVSVPDTLTVSDMSAPGQVEISTPDGYRICFGDSVSPARVRALMLALRG